MSIFSTLSIGPTTAISRNLLDLLFILSNQRSSVTSEEAGLGVVPHSAPQPASSWRTTTIAWTSTLFRRTLSVSHHLPSLGRLPPVRCTARLVLLWAQRLGKTATLVPSRWSFARRHMLDTVELVWTSVKRGHFGRLVTATPRCAHGRVNSDRAVDRSRCEADQTSGTSSPHGSLACLSSQVSRRGVLLVSFSLLDSKRYGRSAPAP